MTPREYLDMYARWVNATAYTGQAVDLDEGIPGPGRQLPIYATLGLAGETGEFVELIKKWTRNPQASRPPQEKLKSELGDIIWYVTRLCNQLGLTLGEVIEYNMEKIDRRRLFGKEAENNPTEVKEGG